VTALDQTWHPDHFFCTQCGCQFGEDGFQEKDGKPYCKEDYLAMFALKCKGCSTAITEGYISALNGQWHPNCFVCRVSFSLLTSDMLSVLWKVGYSSRQSY
jgi:paxillin